MDTRSVAIIVDTDILDPGIIGFVEIDASRCFNPVHDHVFNRDISALINKHHSGIGEVIVGLVNNVFVVIKSFSVQ